MAEFKLVVSDPKTGKSYTREVKEKEADALVGLKIGSNFNGEKMGLTGYEFEVTGGSDNCGFPMRRDAEGSSRKKILITGGVGLKSDRKGMKKRVTVAGNTINEITTQVNLKILKHGKEKLEMPTPKEGGKEKPVEAPKKAKKEEVKVEEKVEEKKEEVKEEKKEEKAEEKKEEEKSEPEDKKEGG